MWRKRDCCSRSCPLLCRLTLLSIDICTLIGDLILIGESRTAEVEESIHGFQQEERQAA